MGRGHPLPHHPLGAYLGAYRASPLARRLRRLDRTRECLATGLRLLQYHAQQTVTRLHNSTTGLTYVKKRALTSRGAKVRSIVGLPPQCLTAYYSSNSFVRRMSKILVIFVVNFPRSSTGRSWHYSLAAVVHVKSLYYYDIATPLL